jgi:hypothetical protein
MFETLAPEHDITVHPPGAKHGRIIYILQSPMTDRDRDRLNVDGFLASGYAVSVIDCGRLMFPTLSFERDHYCEYGDIDITVLASWRDLDQLDERLKVADLVIVLAQSFGVWSRNLPVLRWVSRGTAPYLIMQMNIVPMLSMAPTASARWRARLTYPLHLRPIESLLRRLPLEILGVRPADYVVYDGFRSVRPNRLVGPATRRIFAHSNDVEIWRRRPTGCQSASNVAVFLDQNIPYHRDMQERGDCRNLADGYHAAMRGLFDRIERELGLKVVIAAHPRSNYGGREPFGNRPMVVGNTPGLVAGCGLVIAHWSTAASYAILSGTPLVFCMFSPLLKVHPQIRNMTLGLATSIGKTVETIDDPASVDLTAAQSVDSDAYQRYSEDYLKTPNSPDLPLWDIILGAVGLDRGPPGQSPNP